MNDDSNRRSIANCGAVPRARTATRRGVLRAVAAVSALPLIASTRAANDAATSRPQPGDQLTFAAGERAGQVIAPGDLIAAAPPLSAWPMLPTTMLPTTMLPATKLLRDGSRLNLVRLVRLNASALSPKSAECAADGIVAFAAMCSHAGCDVLGWRAETQHLVCPCHGSEFDALDGAAVIKGPATKPLALLPLKIDNGALLVAGTFTRQVGFKPL